MAIAIKEAFVRLFEMETEYSELSPLLILFSIAARTVALDVHQGKIELFSVFMSLL